MFELEKQDLLNFLKRQPEMKANFPEIAKYFKVSELDIALIVDQLINEGIATKDDYFLDDMQHSENDETVYVVQLLAFKNPALKTAGSIIS